MQDIFLASYDASGNLNWVNRAGGTGNDVSAGIVTSANGDTYITGWCLGTCDFGDSLIVSNGNYDLFVAKYDASGAIQWVRHAGGALDDYGNRVSLTNDGGVTVSGSFKDTLNVNGTQLSSHGNRDCLFVRYTADGQLVWAKGAGGQGEDRGYGIAQDASGNFLVTGLFAGTSAFGGLTLSCNSLFGSFVTKMSDQGDFLWAQKGDAGANDFARGFGAATDQDGNVLINGFFSGTVRMDGVTLTASGGQFDLDAYLIKLNPNGNVIWARHSGGNGVEQATDLYITAGGEVIELGFFHDTAHIGSFPLIAAGAADIYIAKYDPLGNVLSACSFGGSDNEYGYGIVGEAGGDMFITGAFSGSTNLGNFQFTSNGGIDLFVARLSFPEVGIALLESSESISIHPNPASNHVRLTLSDRTIAATNMELQVLDISGDMVMNERSFGLSKLIDVSELSRGTYVLRLIGDGSTWAGKLMLE